MRTIGRTSAFKRNGRFARAIDGGLASLVAELAAARALGGEGKDHRDRHVRPGPVLIYRKPDAEHPDPVRLGSHSQVGP